MLSSEYLAGIFDSDGTITIKRNRKPKSLHGWLYTPNCRIQWKDSKNTRKIFEELCSRYGGTIRTEQYNFSNGFPNRSPTIVYGVSAKKAARLTQDILPFLQLKRRQAELLLELASLQHIGGSPRRITDWEHYAKLCSEVRSLQMKGTGR